MTAATSNDGSIRLGGLASGFDTEAIVEQLLAIDQSRIDQLGENKEINKAKIQTWEDIAEQLKSLSETVSKLKSSGVEGETLFDDKIVTSSSESVVTGIALSSTNTANYEIIVDTLARAHVVYGNQKAAGFTVTAGSFVINGETITTTGGEDLDDVAKLINSASYTPGQEVQANVIDDRLVIQTKLMGADATVYGSNNSSPPFSLPADDANNILQNELEIVNGSGNFVNTAQTAADASLSINGVPVTDSSNTISDSIDGLTLNLSSTGTSSLTISHNKEQIKNTITDFVDLYNETRDLISRVRGAKLSEEDEFGLFSNDSLLRQLFGEVRSLTTGGITLTNGDWDGSITTQAATAGNTSITLDGFDPSATSLKAGDYFSVSGHNQTYKLTSDATITGGSTTINFYPPLEDNVSLGERASPRTRTLEDFGVGIRTDSVSGIAGILGITNEAQLDESLSNDIESIKAVFTKFHTDKSTHTGVARRLYDWIDSQIKISALISKTRSIEDIAIPGINSKNTNIDTQIERLERNLERKRESLIRKFAEMENSISRTQSLGAAIGQIGGASGGG